MDCELSDHSYVLTVYKLKAERESRTLTKSWINYAAVDAEFHTFLVNHQFHMLSVDERLQSVTNRYRELIDRHSRTVTVTVKVKQNCYPWFNFDIWKLGKIRDNVNTRYKRNHQNHRLKELLDHVNQKLRVAKYKAKQAYNNRIFNTSNPKMLWGRINELLGGKSKANESLSLSVDQIEHHDPKVVADLLNEHFVSVGDNVARNLVSDGDINRFQTVKLATRSIFIRPTCCQEVTNIISLLDPNKATGYDGFPVSALKKHCALLSNIISSCFNDSVSNGSYPNCLKRAVVHPIFKSGDRKDPTNYRPISVLPTMNKVFEKLLAKRLHDFLAETCQLYQHQFGFREGSSTEVAILEMIDEVSKTLDQKRSAGTIYLDLSKAFDTINHAMLLKKLDAYGIRGLPNELLRSYLADRHQQVIVSGIRGTSKPVRCGVPQGSVLGPLLFLLYVNDLPNLQLQGKARLFADDTALSYTGVSPSEVIEHMRVDMELVLDFLQNNLLALNVSKTKMMIFRFPKTKHSPHPELIVRGHLVEEVTSYKYLGVHIDNRLSWDVHIHEVTSSCASLCGILRKLSRSVPKQVLMKMYHAFIHSKYQYAIAAWGTACKTHLKELQIQQNRCLKAIYGLHFLHPTRDLYTMPQHTVLPIRGLHFLRTCIIMFKIVNNIYVHHNWAFRTAQHHHHTRGANQIHQQEFRTETGRRRFMIFGPSTFNRLPEDIRETSTINEFKLKLSNYIRHNINNYL